MNKLKQDIRTFLSFVGFSKEEKDNILSKINTIKKAKNCINFLNCPEKYPKYRYGD